MGINEWLTNAVLNIFERFGEIALGPVNHPNMLWIMTPLLINIIFMEFYFSRHKKEELGWNTAFGNNLALLFVSLDLLRYLYVNNQFYFNLRFTLVASIIFVGVFFMILDFFHALPKEYAFILSSRLPVNFLALVGIIVVYTGIPLDFATFLGLVVLLLFLSLILWIVHSLSPESQDEMDI